MEFLIIVIIVAAIVFFFKAKKFLRTSCTKCFSKYDIKQMVVAASELKWEAKEKTKEDQGTTRTGTAYTQITTTRYRIYYRYVTFKFKCPKCGKERVYTKKINLYDTSCGHSQSEAEQLARLRWKIADILGKKFVGNTTIKIKNIDY